MPPPTNTALRRNADQATSHWQRASQQRRPTEFQPGDEVIHVPRRDSRLVHARARRFMPRRFGPYLVIEHYPRNRVLCTDGVRQLLLPGWELQHRASGTFFKGGESKG
jgi:hypothetical protein